MDGEVFLLWHVHHAAHDDGRVDHLDESGEVRVEEEFGDSVKLLGVYSSHQSASGRMDLAKSLPGFSDEPDCFILSKYKIDDDHWVEGFQAVQLEA